MQDIFPEASEGVTITPDMVVVEKVAAMNQLQGTFLYGLLQRVETTQEAHALILANLGEAGRRGYEKSRFLICTCVSKYKTSVFAVNENAFIS